MRPILSGTCFKCHGFDSGSRKAGLRLDVREEALRPRENGTPIVPGHPERSEAWRRLTSDDPEEVMPPPESHLKLTAAQVATLRQWIEEGAGYEPHWAFAPVRRPPPAAVKDAGWVRNPIDSFVLAGLESQGLTPSPEADRRTLIRRLSLDLLGLPPSPAEVEAFVRDPSPDAYEQVVDRLLASPHYGERMAMDWLDGARYADSNGYQSDDQRFMWPWRDWVIDAFNRNEPFDRFTVEQLAGDLLPNATLRDRTATGFNRNHRINVEAGIHEEEWRVETVVDRVETTSAVWLGLTLGCCRCHDHKYDPITQKEFYQFSAFFNNVAETGGGADKPVNTPPVLKIPGAGDMEKLAALRRAMDAAAAARDAEAARGDAAAISARAASGATAGVPVAVEAALAMLPAAARDDVTGKGVRTYYATAASRRWRELNASVKAARKARDDFDAGIPNVMVMQDLPEPREAFVLVRGVFDQHGEKVTPGTPAALPPMPAGAPRDRLGLARWIMDPANPLTARVWVNRAWGRFFGVGLVRTGENFGLQGEPPSNPELLDWLASEFVRLGWDMKALQRAIVTSATYRQSSGISPDLLERDPENRLLARGPRFRLQAEVVRDNALAVAGLLVDKTGGPPVRPYQPEGVWDDTSALGSLRNYRHDSGDALYRRSLYTIWKRTAAPPQMTTFDMPSREVCVVRRSRTNTPLQALVLLNDVTFVEAARALAQAMIREGGASPRERVRFAFRRAVAHPPTGEEEDVLCGGLERRLARYRRDPAAASALIHQGDSKPDPAIAPAELAAYTVTASVILNLDETVTKE